jgi:hypothetical protein
MAATDWNGRTAIPSPAAIAKASRIEPAAANDPAADVARESPVLLSMASADATVTQAKISALGTETFAACDPRAPRYIR